SANEDLTAADSRSVLEGTAWKPDDWSEPGDEQDVRYGYGIVDAYAAVDEVGAAVYEYDLGDVNQDESVNVQDVQLTQQYIYGMNPEGFNEDLGDLNRDGEVDTTDLNLLQYKIQGNLDLGTIDVSNLEGPDEADQGTEIEISADLENTGEEGAIEELAVHMAETKDDLGSGEPVTTTFVDLAAPGVSDPVGHPAETTVTLTVDTSGFEPGEYYYGLYAEDDSETDSLTLVSSYFEVSNLDAPGEVDQGDEIEVSGDVENTGNAADTQTVEFRFDDLDEALLTEEVSLEPGEGTGVSFTVDTSDIEAGTYDHGVFTDDDSETATITILAAFFDVEITDAPGEVAVGDGYDVDATVENTGDAPDTQTVTYDVVQGETDVAVVDGGVDEEEHRREVVERDVEAEIENAADIVETLQGELDSDRYGVSAVDASDLLSVVGEYDVFVVNDFDEADVGAFLDELGDDQGVVYLENWGGSSASITDLSAATGDPSTVEDGYSGSTPINLELTADHALFTGVGEAGDTVELHAASAADRAWFDGYSGETVADVAATDGEPDGSAVGVSDDGREVLLATFGRSSFVSDDDFSADADAILGNAVVYVDDTGVVAGIEQTSEEVSLAPGESATVEFANTLGDVDPDLEWFHAVESEDDQDLVAFTAVPAGATVEGTVTDAESGDPIEGATVTLDADGGTYTATTDADGTYSLAGIPAGEHEITVTAEDYAEITETIEVPEDGAVTYDAALEPAPGSISGQVTASDDGEPVEGVTIVGENGDGDTYETTTDAEGQYALDVPAGTYVVTVAATPPGYQPEEIVTVSAGETVEG
ncbi:carboxypeptidase regulatory-like domain-containing protein, partial [Saliphagus sp. LR7]|uniref:carboxypeptidase regulatory-like domain-containing protein n=1 Tax=Saliphagus sp. LR7 TaxID=2282654 RepID=UPI000DF788BD